MRAWIERWFGGRERKPAAQRDESRPATEARLADKPVPDDLDALLLAIALPEQTVREPVHGIEPELALRELAEHCSAARDANRQFPRLPAVLPELLALLRSQKANSRQLAKLVERDPALLGEVVRIAGSAYYGSSRAINSLTQAIVMIGDDGLRRMVAAALSRPIHRGTGGQAYRSAAPHFAALSEHCGRLCGERYRGANDPFEAYLAGTFRHAGAMMLVRLFDDYAELRAARRAPEFTQRFMALEAALSVRAARHWQFPPRVVAALAHAAGEPAPGAEPALVTALSQAEHAAKVALLVAGERPADRPAEARPATPWLSAARLHRPLPR